METERPHTSAQTFPATSQNLNPEPVSTYRRRYPVIPAKAGIQGLRVLGLEVTHQTDTDS